jgi:hypothetical protein
LRFNRDFFFSILDEEVNSEILFLLPANEIDRIFPRLNMRVKFLAERNKLSDRIKADLSVLPLSPHSSPLQLITDNTLEIAGNETISSLEENFDTPEVDITDVDDAINCSLKKAKSKLPIDYSLPTFPPNVQTMIAEGKHAQLGFRTNARRDILNVIFNDLRSKYNIL